jgi:signal transduction histidine kinase
MALAQLAQPAQIAEPAQSAATAELDDSLRDMALQLEAAKAALAQAEQTHSEFLFSMGHALRSPLTAILGFAQLMDAAVPMPTERQKSSLAQILQAGWGLLSLIDEIMDVSLIQSGKLQLQMESVSLEEILRACETLAQPLLQQGNAQLSFALPGQPLVVAADRQRLQQILMTLLGHALQLSGSGGSVQVSCHGSAQGRVRVQFEDTSCGLSSAWRARSATTNDIKLIVSRQLAGLMGASIGTEFSATGLIPQPSIANACADSSGYWLELNSAGSTP